jgi:hypothetical protein
MDPPIRSDRVQLRDDRLVAMKTLVVAVIAVLVAAVAGGCGGSKRAAQATSTGTTRSTGTTTAQTSSSPGALQAESQSAATGDIPDNQTFVVFTEPAAGYTIKYPEGWAQSGGGAHVVFRDKNNIIRIVVRNGGLPSPATVRREVGALPGATLVKQPRQLKLPSGTSIKVVYSTRSAPNAVTGKRVTLVVDRYYLSHGAKQAIVDLGTPQGVDNVDAYRLMIESFRWR